jgi:hypothetical protein
MDLATDPAGFGQNGRDPVRSDWIRKSPTEIQQFWPDPAKYARRNSATATGCYRIPATIAFSPFVILSCEPNTGKYFRKNYFFLI